MSLRYGELFAGYHGLGMGLQSVIGGSTAWFSEFDKAPSAILAHHWPDVPNHGDITKIDFTKVEPVDVLTGGFPCQDVSHAGRRAGLIRDGEGRTRSGLWGEMLRAITELRPRLVVAENVRGLLSAAADSDVEPCPWCLGDANGEPDMRALGAVLADLADVGYDAWWVGLRAADVGGAHGRFRVFIFAVPADAHGAGLGGLGWLEPVGRDAHGCGRADGPRTSTEPETRDGLTLLPTPAVNDMGEGKTVDHWDAWTATMQAKHGNGNGHGKSLAIEAQRLLPTLTVNDAGNVGGESQFDRNTVPLSHALLPTPSLSMADRGGAHPDSRAGHTLNLQDVIEHMPSVKGQPHGNADPARAREDLRDVRDATGAEAIQRQARGPGRVPAPAVLQPELLEGEGIGAGKLSPLARPTGDATDGVRDVRDDSGSAHSPQGPGRDEQPTGEPRQPLQQLPPETPLARGQGRPDGVDFGAYTGAIQRWEQVLGRPAPSPTEPGRNGAQRLSPRFCEWLMGLPAGHVTDVDIPRNAQLKALGNGVVPQQSAAACRWWLTQIRSAAA